MYQLLLHLAGWAPSCFPDLGSHTKIITCWTALPVLTPLCEQPSQTCWSVLWKRTAHKNLILTLFKCSEWNNFGKCSGMQVSGAWAKGVHRPEGSIFPKTLPEWAKAGHPFKPAPSNIHVLSSLGSAGAPCCPSSSQVSEISDTAFNMQVQSLAFTLTLQSCLSDKQATARLSFR